MTADPLFAQPSSMTLRLAITAELEVMLRFAWSRGLPLPPELHDGLACLDAKADDGGEALAAPTPLATLAGLHALLAQAIAPAKPGGRPAVVGACACQHGGRRFADPGQARAGTAGRVLLRAGLPGASAPGRRGGVRVPVASGRDHQALIRCACHRRTAIGSASFRAAKASGKVSGRCRKR
jgi:hypothetical protein